MLNRSALSSTLPPAIAPAISPTSGEHASSISRARWMRMVGMLRLPSTLRGYVAFLASLLVLAFTMTLHIMLSAEIMRLNVQLYDLESEYARVERYNANIVWNVSEHSSLVDLHSEALAAGYVNSIPTEYVNMPVATTFTAPAIGASTTPPGALSTRGSVGAIDGTVTDPAAPQPQFVVITGEPNTSDPAANGQAITGALGGNAGQDGTLQDNSVAAPRVGALAPQNNGVSGAQGEESWWQRNTPEWLRFERVGDAVDETLDWIRERMPSPEWLQQRW